MMVKGRVSIAACNFNDYWVLKMMDAILQQDYHDVELLIRNDGKDIASNTIYKTHLPQIKEKFAKKGFRLVTLDGEDEGMFPAVQDLLLNHATGEYFSFVEADSFWFKSTASKFVKILQDGHDAVCADIQKVCHCGGLLPPTVLKDTIQCGMYWSASCMFTKETFLELGGFNLNWVYGEQEFGLRLYVSGKKVGYLPEVGRCTILHEDKPKEGKTWGNIPRQKMLAESEIIHKIRQQWTEGGKQVNGILPKINYTFSIDGESGLITANIIIEEEVNAV